MFNTKSFKKTVRSRMDRTGKSYTSTRRDLVRATLRAAFGSPTDQHVARDDGSQHRFDGWHLGTFLRDSEHYLVHLDDQGCFQVQVSLGAKNTLLTAPSAELVREALERFCSGKLTDYAERVAAVVIDAEARAARGVPSDVAKSAGYKARPFEKRFQDRARKMTVIRGDIRSDGFVVAVLGHEMVLATQSVGQDARGPFALVEEGEYELRDGFRLVVQVEHDEHFGAGLAIGVVRDGPVREAMATALLEQGLEAHLISPYEDAFFVYLGSSGTVNGTSGILHDGQADVLQ